MYTVKVEVKMVYSMTSKGWITFRSQKFRNAVINLKMDLGLLIRSHFGVVPVDNRMYGFDNRMHGFRS